MANTIRHFEAKLIDEKKFTNLVKNTEALDGLEAFTKNAYYGDKAHVANLIERFGKNEDDMTEILMLIKRADDVGDAGEGSVKGMSGVIKQLGGSLNNPGVNNKALAARYTLRYFERQGELKNLVSLETRTKVKMVGDDDGISVRVIDAVAKKEYEIKNWTSGKVKWDKGREPEEFVLDTLRHMPDFDKLKWIINSNAKGNSDKLKAKMLEALNDWRIAKQIEWMKKNKLVPKTYTVQKLKEDFEISNFNKIVEFVADTKVDL